MRRSVSRLRETLAGLTGQRLAPEHVSRVVQWTRHVIEERQAQAFFPVLNLYCNWLQHPKIDRSHTGDQILAEIDDILFVRKKVTTFSPEAIQSTIGVQGLRLELTALLKADNLRCDLVENDDCWKDFIRLVIRDLCAKPLMFRQLQANKTNYLFDSVLNAIGRVGEFYVSSASFSDDANDLMRYPNPPDFLLKVTAHKVTDSTFCVHVMVPIVL
jgi:hypothetical protein